MSSSSSVNNYRVTFETNNRYFKYFCDHPASEWELDHFKANFPNENSSKLANIYLSCLNTIKDLGDIPQALPGYISILISSVRLDQTGEQQVKRLLTI